MFTHIWNAILLFEEGGRELALRGRDLHKLVAVLHPQELHRLIKWPAPPATIQGL